MTGTGRGFRGRPLGVRPYEHASASLRVQHLEDDCNRMISREPWLFIKGVLFGASIMGAIWLNVVMT